MMRLAAILPNIEYDLCVLTGDYRAQTFGAYEPALTGMAPLCSALKGPIYGVLGNHDTIQMVPGLEDMGVQMLLNENHTIERGNQRIYLAGIDDAHFYRVDNIEKAATGIPFGDFSILPSHTPEVYQQASYADFSLLLSGHTHGGQICLPGRIPITLSSVLPGHIGSGPWKYRDMIGYTSVGAGSSVVPEVQLPPRDHAALPTSATSPMKKMIRKLRISQLLRNVSHVVMFNHRASFRFPATILPGL